jgi:hypothetical protein
MKYATKKKFVRAAARVICFVSTLLIVLGLCFGLCACEASASWWDEPSGSQADTQNTKEAANRLQTNQPTPTDIDYSLERYNLTRRAYWVNGQREKANALTCPIVKPLGYVVLLTESGSVVAKFTVDGKVSSLNSFLTPDSEYYEEGGGDWGFENKWLADVDGSYGENDNGIFFFTPDGKYVEWSGIYLYSDIPFEVAAPVVNYTEVG